MLMQEQIGVLRNYCRSTKIKIMAPIPVVLVGRLGPMGRMVAENLKPEVESVWHDLCI